MRFKGLDLNLLAALDALIELQSVSRAAERLHLSQPAMSAVLGRLRAYFNDPILISSGKGMLPTPQALQMQPMLRQLLTSIDRLVTASAVFDPATSQRRFRIGASDYVATVIFSRLLRELETRAPGIGIELVPPSDELASNLERGRLDLVILPEMNLVPLHPTELLFEERFVVAGWSENPLLRQRLTEATFYEAGHVAVEIGEFRPTSFIEAALGQRGRARRIDVIVTVFSLVPMMLVGTRRLAVMHERMARESARVMPIVTAELPFEFPLMRQMLQYHSSRAEDSGLTWLRAAITTEVLRTALPG
ncbi:MAG: LysR family transcriptional regulator [Gammaproteobacteria bacterium]|nr:MAG: LysR family transcriptional regulator [Gammaproteobacteria bacterium]